ncbi:hypothetical protein PPERSA_05263 [Pseudocohnilembus persalinus]|uniref:Uncharacterized protein n=1 Tax=Pseudocohnilembus persalinus TaxID=266149 RepID=A0A0V0QXX4_PSEPJ|nr:hypothetical protein PPERSA_05263 [Pseudocohnilembus persalinus]|eukprot:KRX07099.1 hypothetical protein PPERSA_05263 [Pseudocohnilembus persalinus]
MGKNNNKNEPYKMKVNILFLETYLKVSLEKKWTVKDMIENTITKQKKKIEKVILNNQPLEKQEKPLEFGLFDDNQRFQYNPEYLCKDLLPKSLGFGLSFGFEL